MEKVQETRNAANANTLKRKKKDQTMPRFIEPTRVPYRCDCDEIFFSSVGNRHCIVLFGSRSRTADPGLLRFS